jgi:hypothetical protein
VFTAQYVLHSTFCPVYLCVLCGSENQQRLFHCTALTGWFGYYKRDEVCYLISMDTFHLHMCVCVCVYKFITQVNFGIQNT